MPNWRRGRGGFDLVIAMGKSKAFGEFGFLLLSNLLISILSYVSTVGIANRLGPDDFGRYSYIMVVGLMLSQLVIFGTDDTIVAKHVNSEKNVIERIYRTRFVNLIAITVFVLCYSLLSGDRSILYALMIATQGLSLSSVYEVHGENRTYARIFLLERAFYILSLWGGIWMFDGANLNAIFWGLCFWTTASLGYQAYKKREYLSFSFSLDGLLKIWVGGLPLVIFVLSKYMYGGGVRIFIKSTLGYSALGIYSAAWQFVPLIGLFMSQITKSWRYQLTLSVQTRNLPMFLKNIAQVSFVAIAPIVLFAVAFSYGGGRLMAMIFSREYSSATALLPVLSIYFVVIAFDVINSMLWVSLGRTKFFGAIFCFFSICCFLFLWVKGRDAELMDYIVTVVVSHGLSVIVSLILVSFALRIQFGGVEK